MKTKKRAFLSLKIAIIAVVLLPVVTWADGELSVVLEGQTASTNRQKFGWIMGMEAAQCVPPCEENAPKYYKTRSSSAWHQQWGDDPPQVIESASMSVVEQFTNNTASIYTSATGTCGCPGCSGVVINHTLGLSWLLTKDGMDPYESINECDCHWTYGWQSLTDVTVECLSPASYKSTATIIPWYGIGTSVVNVAFSDEYATQELLNPSGFDYQGTDWNDTSGAFSDIAWDESSATIQKGKYRFKVLADKGKRFTIHFTEHYSNQGGYYTNSETSLRRVGTRKLRCVVP